MSRRLSCLRRATYRRAPLELCVPDASPRVRYARDVTDGNDGIASRFPGLPLHASAEHVSPHSFEENTRGDDRAKASNGSTRDPEEQFVVAIVDDDFSVRRALSRLLRSCGLLVETYESAEEFLASASPSDVSCLLLDLQMTGMTGIDLLEGLAATGDLPPTIVITAHGSVDARARTARAGVPLLHKPVESSSLVAAVGQAIGKDLSWPE